MLAMYKGSRGEHITSVALLIEIFQLSNKPEVFDYMQLASDLRKTNTSPLLLF